MSGANGRLVAALGAVLVLSSPASAWPADAPAAPPPIHQITHPDWAAKPTADDMAQLYPAGARDRQIGGMAVIRCTVAASGAVVGCRAVAETPQGLGFAAAAVKLSRKFEMARTLADGSSSAGSDVEIPIRWSIGGADLPRWDQQGSALITVLGPAGPSGGGAVAGCPSTAEPLRRCQAHRIAWVWPPEPPPGYKHDYELFGPVDQTKGVSTLTCHVHGDGTLLGGTLTDCAVGGEATAQAKAAILALAAELRAPAAAIDGTPVGPGPVMALFDWATVLRPPKP